MNLTLRLFEFIVEELRHQADCHDSGTEEHETLEDAADALADVVDMLSESGDL